MKSGVREFAFVSQALGSFKTAMYAVRAQTPAELQAGMRQAIANASANAQGPD